MDTYHELYPVNEYFQSVQGEGNFSGVNCFFIRFHFCNLTCTWCDTKYTWQVGIKREMMINPEEIKRIISENTANHVIFTGGEPAMYRLDNLVVPGKKYHVETNGTIIPTEPLELTLKSAGITRNAMDLDIIKWFNWVVSPKLSNTHQKLNEKSMQYWVNSGFCIFKFIIRNPVDLEEVDKIRQKFDINKTLIYIGLEGQTLESQLQPALVDEIIRYGFNFSPRLHVILWGNKRMR
jgi:7-carboxy-7-deazaguanine synthase